jgi:outer membrane protein TolC
MLKIIKKCFLLSCCLLCWKVEATKKLSLEAYLNQVRHCNSGVIGYYLSGEGARERTKEGCLLTRPTLFAEGELLKNDSTPGWNPLTGDRSTLQTYKAGISQTSRYGLTSKLYYNYQHQTTSGPAFVERDRITSSSPVIEMGLPLSRNFGGKETQAMAQLTQSNARLKQYSEYFKINTLIAQAEALYWRLAITRQIMIKQQEGLKRAEKIKEWVSKRQQLCLAGESDLLQAEAGVEAKKLDLQATLNNERIAAQDFNTLRGQCQLAVPEQLTSFHEGLADNLVLPSCPGVREDVLAAEQEQKIQIANAILGIEKNKPDIELYGSYALNGKSANTLEAIAQSFSIHYPTTAIGLRLSLPLDLWQLNKNRCAYRKEIEGANYQFQQKVYENKRLWEEIVIKIRNAQDRLTITKKLEEIQLRKLEVEHQRLANGKTTTYQVLLFEQEYTSAQIATLLVEDEILQLLAELKTFGGSIKCA